jgi:integrase
MKLTIKTIGTLKLPEGQSECEVYDDEISGFGIRIRGSGKQKFVFRYRNASGKNQRVTIGPASAETVGPARKRAAELALEVAAGKDPAQAKETAKHEASNSFGAAVDGFLAQFTGRVPRYTAEVTRHLTEYAEPLHKLPLTKVTQRDIANLLNQMDKRGKATANRVRGSLYGFFTWVLSEGVVLPAGNPVANTRVRDEQSRDRVLTADEIRAVWNGCIDDDFGAVVKLLLLTGQRREEIAALRYDEIVDVRPDLPRGEFQIQYPKMRVKNGLPHFVPLSDPAKAIIDSFPRDGREYPSNLGGAKRDDREYLFGRDDRGFRGSPNAKTRLDKRCGVKDWTIHDLRRTVATHMAQDLGIAPHVIEAILNHVSGHKAGVAGIYNRATYPKERREALNLWAEHLMAIVEGRAAKVVPMRRA